MLRDAPAWVLAVVATACRADKVVLVQSTARGSAQLSAGLGNGIVALETTLVVPAEPQPSGGLALWPGLEPLPSADGTSLAPIGSGVLQSVLNWGDSCLPGAHPPAYSTWWVSAGYVNTTGGDPAHTGCFGGPVMSVGVGDALQVTMALAGTVWHQEVLDRQSNAKVSFDEDLMGQSQNLALFVIEEFSSAPVSDVVFSDTTITLAFPDPTVCGLTASGLTDSVSTPQPSADGTQCFISTIVLR